MFIRYLLLVLSLLLAGLFVGCAGEEDPAQDELDGIQQSLVETQGGVIVNTTVAGKTTTRSCNAWNCSARCACKFLACIEAHQNPDLCADRQDACFSICEPNQECGSEDPFCDFGTPPK